MVISESMLKEYQTFNQCCGVKLPIKNGRTIELVLIYRPHNQYDQRSVSDNNEKLLEVLRNAPKPNIFVGDFNYSGIDWKLLHSDANGRTFLEEAQDAFLHQHVDFSTHHSGTMPDLVLSSNPENVIGVEDVGRLGKSDHSMLLVHVSGSLEENVTYEEVPDWSRAD